MPWLDIIVPLELPLAPLHGDVIDSDIGPQPQVSMGEFLGSLSII
jgi:hypothetical protein